MKEKMILAGLEKHFEGAGIRLNVRALARFTADNGVLVSVRCGRRRGRIKLPPNLVGLRPEKWDEGPQAFFDAHIDVGRLTLIPKEYEARLNQLDTRVRRALQDSSINGNYVPLAVFPEFKETFEEIREEYLSVIGEVAEHWPELTQAFEEGLRETASKQGKRALGRDAETMVNTIMGLLPTAEQYRAAAYMDLEVRAFPTTGNTTEGLAPDLQDTINRTWRDDVVANAIKSIETQLGKVFAQACRTARAYAKGGKMDPRSVAALSRIAGQVRKVNIFSNPMLEQLGNRLSSLSGLSDESIEEVLEESIVDAYVYAKSTGVTLDMSESPFTAAQLEDMNELRLGLGKDA